MLTIQQLEELRRIRSIIDCNEGLFVEFKADLSRRKPEAICKEIAAFSTTNDGTILIGISDDKSILGLQNPVEVRDKIERWAHAFVSPAPLFDAYPFTIEDKKIVVIEVKKGPALLYSYDGKLYGRFGTSSNILKTHHIEELIRGQSLEQAIEGLKSNVAVAQSTAILAQYSTAPAIQGQGDLATMQYGQVRDKILADLASSPMMAAINSGIAVAQSLASIAQASPAPGIFGQGDLATINYSDLLERLNSDIALMNVVQQLKSDILAAQSTAWAASASANLANARAEQAISKIEKLMTDLRQLTELP